MSKQKRKIIDFFNSRAHIWDEICTYDASMLKQITEFCKIKENDTILDVACGTGVMISYLLNTPAKDIIGIDISEKMIEKAKEKHMHKRVEFVVGDIYTFDKTEFDVVLIHNAYPHLTDRDKLIDSLKRLLIKGGRFMIAHSPGAKSINAVHDGKPKDISLPLERACDEAELFKNDFVIDTVIDNDDLYIVSGTLK